MTFLCPPPLLSLTPGNGGHEPNRPALIQEECTSFRSQNDMTGHTQGVIFLGFQPTITRPLTSIT